MGDDVLERIGVAVARETGIQMSPEAVRVGVRVLLEDMDKHGGFYVAVGARHYALERLNLDLTSTAAAEPATEPGEDTGQPYTGRIELAGERFGECVGPEEFGQLDEQGRWVPKTGQVVDKKV